eukprot:jgi/Mesvir1/187/Mv13539-RA.1
MEDGTVKLVDMGKEVGYEVSFNTRGRPTAERVNAARVTRSRKQVRLATQPDTAKLKHQVAGVKQKLAAVADTVLTSFDERFPAVDMMQAFEVLHPEWWEDPKPTSELADTINPIVQLYCEKQTCTHAA